MTDKKKIKVLVVDDEPDIVEILKYNLQKEGYDVATAEDGLKAVKTAIKFQPDVILLDIMMPNQDGVETCLQIRQIPELKHAFIIFLTARLEEYSEVAAFDVGADDYITKPIKPRALMSRIAALFRRDSKKDQDKAQIKIRDLQIDRSSYTINKAGKHGHREDFFVRDNLVIEQATMDRRSALGVIALVAVGAVALVAITGGVDGGPRLSEVS
jgi:two-component system alkaline phosphatase synthesis response regulator PhoP